MPEGLIGKYIYNVIVRLYQAGELPSVSKGKFVEYFNKAEPTNEKINGGMLAGYLNNGVRPVAEKLAKIESLDPARKVSNTGVSV